MQIRVEPKWLLQTTGTTLFRIIDECAVKGMTNLLMALSKGNACFFFYLKAIMSPLTFFIPTNYNINTYYPMINTK